MVCRTAINQATANLNEHREPKNTLVPTEQDNANLVESAKAVDLKFDEPRPSGRKRPFSR